MKFSEFDVKLLKLISDSEEVIKDVKLSDSSMPSIEVSVKEEKDFSILKNLLSDLKSSDLFQSKDRKSSSKQIVLELEIDSLDSFFRQSDRSLMKLILINPSILIELKVKDKITSKAAIKNFENSLKGRRLIAVSEFLSSLIEDFFNSSSSKELFDFLRFFSFKEIFLDLRNVKKYFLNPRFGAKVQKQNRTAFLLASLLQNEKTENILEVISFSTASEVESLISAAETISKTLNQAEASKLIRRLRSIVSSNRAALIKFQELKKNRVKILILDSEILYLMREIDEFLAFQADEKEKILVESKAVGISKIEIDLKKRRFHDLDSKIKEIESALSNIDPSSSLTVHIVSDTFSSLKSEIFKEFFKKKKLKFSYSHESSLFDEQLPESALNFLFKAFERSKSISLREFFSFLLEVPLDKKDLTSFIDEFSLLERIKKTSTNVKKDSFKSEFKKQIKKIAKKLIKEEFSQKNINEKFFFLIELSKKVFERDKSALLEVIQGLFDVAHRNNAPLNIVDELSEMILDLRTTVSRFKDENKSRLSEIKNSIIQQFELSDFENLEIQFERISASDLENIKFSDQEREIIRKKILEQKKKNFFEAFEAYLLLKEKIDFSDQELRKEFEEILSGFEKSRVLKEEFLKLYRKRKKPLIEEFLSLVAKIDPEIVIESFSHQKRSLSSKKDSKSKTKFFV